MGPQAPRRHPAVGRQPEPHIAPAKYSERYCIFMGKRWQYLDAEEARKQQARVPKEKPEDEKYPSYFGNFERLPLSIKASMIDYPCLIPNYRKRPGYLHFPLKLEGQKADKDGPIRSVYHPGDPMTFDVIFHDERLPKRPGSKRHPFSLAIKQRRRLSGSAGGGSEWEDC